ncbi:hypothetical protein ASD12_31735 [Mesorhizobium sp. Root102]|nr:hypothetical protein ASD12_31735 [Mesorhizobium sp. Root102]
MGKVAARLVHVPAEVILPVGVLNHDFPVAVRRIHDACDRIADQVQSPVVQRQLKQGLDEQAAEPLEIGGDVTDPVRQPADQSGAALRVHTAPQNKG